MVYMDTLSLKNRYWSFENINLQISSCSLADVHLNISQNFRNESYSDSGKGIKVFIDRSNLGYLRTENVSQVRIRNSYITGRKIYSAPVFL